MDTDYVTTGSENTLENVIRSYFLSEPGEKTIYYFGESAPEHFPHMIRKDNKKHMMLCALFTFAWNEMCEGRVMLCQRKVPEEKRERKGKFTKETEAYRKSRTAYIMIKRKNQQNIVFRRLYKKKEIPNILMKTINKLVGTSYRPNSYGR